MSQHGHAERNSTLWSPSAAMRLRTSSCCDSHSRMAPACRMATRRTHRSGARRGLVRQYSLTGSASPGESSWEIAVLREPHGRGGSQWIFDSLHAASKVRVRGPRNHFALEPAPNYSSSRRIGITPIRAMVAAAERAGIPWRLLYGGRRASSMAYVDELVSNYGDKVLIRPRTNSACWTWLAS